VALGSDLQNFVYCCKDGNVFALRAPDPDPDPKGATLLAAAQTLSTEQFIQTYPETWLEHRTSLERIMLIAAIAKARTWDGDLHEKNLWIWGARGVGKSLFARQQSALGSTLLKNSDIWWEGYSLTLTGGVIVENYPAAPAGDRMAGEMLKWGDRYPFAGQVKGSTLLADPGRFTLIVTSHYPIEQCFSGDLEREAMKGRFQEVEMTVDNSDILMGCWLNRGIFRTETIAARNFPCEVET
jgi:hypothetical protein